MSLEMKVDALIRLFTAETEEEHAKAMATCRGMLDNSSSTASGAKEKDIDALTRNLLLDIGVPDGVLGHRYLVSAISMAVKDPTALNAMVKRLYPAVAEAHRTTRQRAERAIRHAIETTWNDRSDYEVLAGYFGNTVSRLKGNPTNREFIARIANIVRSQIGGDC